MKDRVFPKPIGVVMVKDDNKFIELIEKLSNIAVQGYDKERNVIYWNKTSELLYGYTKAEALGKKLEDLIIPEPMRDAVTQGISNWDENGVPASQLELQHKDGSAITVYSSHVMLYEDTNEPEMFCLDIDISKQKRQESELAFVNERMELALLGNSDGVWDWNILTNDIYYAPRWKEMLGYRDDELPNAFHVWEEKMHKEDVAGTLEDVQTHLSGQSEFMDSTLRLQCKDESWIWVRCRAKAIFDKDANPVRMIGTNTDITKEKNIEQQLIKQAQIIEQVHDSVISTDIQGNILTWNSGSESMLGYTAQEVVGKNMSILHRVDDIVKNQEYAKELLHKESFSVDAYLVSKDKREIPVLVSLSLLKDERGNPIGLIGVSQDITERKRIEEELATQKEILSHQAHHDFLTGLPNRLLFHDRLEYAIKEAQRHKTKVALLFIDLDHFKEINDSLGHGIGDQVLQEITLRLRHSIRDEDSIARLGGDEFTVILKNIEHAQDASLVAEKLLKTLSETIESIGSENRLYISSSIGISIYPDDGADSQSLLKFADSAMYRAKDEGRNNYQYYSSEMTELAFERVVMETALRAAIEKEEFVVYYQPQVNAIENRVVGMEALVRWMHPTMGMISPAKFIPLAEATGLIVELDRYVMKSAMRQFAQWYEKGLKPGVLTMNLSIQQLKKSDFIEVLKSLLQDTKCKPEWIELEVTESQIMVNPDEAIKTLQKINDLGVALAVDDFGTGYSSLAYLKRLPINKLKIDQAFVKDLPDDEEDSVITKTIIALAKSLNLHVIAEGVETVEQKDFLVKHGCNHIQGYFYFRPLPAVEIEAIGI